MNIVSEICQIISKIPLKQLKVLNIKKVKSSSERVSQPIVRLQNKGLLLC